MASSFSWCDKMTIAVLQEYIVKVHPHIHDFVPSTWLHVSTIYQGSIKGAFCHANFVQVTYANDLNFCEL